MAKSKTVVTVISKISERPTTRNAALVVIYGEDLGRKYDLDRNLTIIGRSSKCDIQVDQDSISRNHAKIVLDGKSANVSDMGSTNGTWVDRQRITGPTTLTVGHQLKVGRTVLELRK